MAVPFFQEHNPLVRTGSRITATYFVLLLILLIGSYLRVVAVAETVVASPIRADARDYYIAALNVQKWKVYSREFSGAQAPEPDQFRPPAYSFIISPLVELPPTEEMLRNIGYLQVALGVLTILLTYILFRPLQSSFVALGAAFFVAISPHLVMMTVYLLTETLFTFLIVLALVLVSKSVILENWRFGILAGIVFGVSALTRTTMEYWPIFLLALYPFLPKRKYVLAILPTAGAALVLVLAWKIRGVLEVGSISDPSLFVSTVHHGMYPNLLFNDLPITRGYPYRFDPFSKEITGLRDILVELSNRFGRDPLAYAWWYSVGKALMLFSWSMVESLVDIYIYVAHESPYDDNRVFVATRFASWLLHWPLTIAALAGWLLIFVSKKWLCVSVDTSIVLVLVGLLGIYFICVHTVGAPFPRYGVPLRPIVYGVGLFVLFSAYSRISGRLVKFKPLVR